MSSPNSDYSLIKQGKVKSAYQSSTNPNNILDSFKSASRYVRGLIEDPSVGIDKVENILDAAHSIKYQLS